MQFDLATWTIAIATVVLAFVTAALVYYTKQLVGTANQPSVVATLEPNSISLNYFDIRVANEGTGTAFNVEVQSEPKLPQHLSEKFAQPLQVISVLRAGQHLSSFLCDKAKLSGNSYRLEVSWARKPRGDRCRISYTINMSDFESFTTLGSDPLRQIAEQVKKLREDWQGVASGSKRIGIDAYDEAERACESEALARLLKEVAAEREPQ